jgi:hypothetical protein
VAPDDPLSPDDDPLSGDSADDPAADLRPDDPAESLDVENPAENLGPDDPSEGLGPDVPQVPQLSDEDAPSELKKRFWSLVLVFNVALFGMSLGAMLIGFEGRWRVGGAIFAVGAFAFVRGWLGYRKVTRRREADDGERADAGDADDEETGADEEETGGDGEESRTDGDEAGADGDESVRKD